MKVELELIIKLGFFCFFGINFSEFLYRSMYIYIYIYNLKSWDSEV